MTHHRKVCQHGAVISQCRCPHTKVDILVPCPPSHDKQFAALVVIDPDRMARAIHRGHLDDYRCAGPKWDEVEAKALISRYMNDLATDGTLST